jgi:hypothetical protein
LFEVISIKHEGHQMTAGGSSVILGLQAAAV